MRTIKPIEDKYLLPTAELVPGGLDGVHGQVCYKDHKALR